MWLIFPARLQGAQKALNIVPRPDPYTEQLAGLRLCTCWFGVSNLATQPARGD